MKRKIYLVLAILGMQPVYSLSAGNQKIIVRLAEPLPAPNIHLATNNS